MATCLVALRAFPFAPDAPARDARSKWLLFSNTEDTGLRATSR
ncbi:hypothetical protein [Streptomyces oceani]|nr:hypothetical protein [Streptomyces oceani]